MEIIREPFEERGEPDEDGLYDYIYKGVYYTFRRDGQQLIFTLYSDEPEEACLKDPIAWRPDVYASAFFKEAVEFLSNNESIRNILVCDPTPPGRGFIPLSEAAELARATGLPTIPRQ